MQEDIRTLDPDRSNAIGDVSGSETSGTPQVSPHESDARSVTSLISEGAAESGADDTDGINDFYGQRLDSQTEHNRMKEIDAYFKKVICKSSVPPVVRTKSGKNKRYWLLGYKTRKLPE